MSKYVVFLALLMSVIGSQVFAADTTQIVIAADSSSGTYRKMLGEIIGVCASDEFNIQEAKGVSGGAPGNLDALINNQAQAAFLHSDVFFANSQADPSYKRFQTLVALYPEPIHILTLRTSKTKKQGTFAFGTQEFNTLSDLKGFVVGAAGGGMYTARILQGQGEAGFKSIAQFGSGKEVIEALNNGEIAAAIFVGAAPLPNIAALDKNTYRLLPLDEAVGSKVKGVYRPVTINYAGLTNGPVQTMAPLATLLTRKFNTPNKVNGQRHFRECFYKNLDQLKDNGSPNWQAVEPGDHGVLDWYDIPTTTKK